MLQLRLDDEFPRSLITTFFGYISNFSVNKHYYIKKTEEWTNYKLKCVYRGKRQQVGRILIPATKLLN
jgi:hypothetical protein